MRGFVFYHEEYPMPDCSQTGGGLSQVNAFHKLVSYGDGEFNKFQYAQCGWGFKLDEFSSSTEDGRSSTMVPTNEHVLNYILGGDSITLHRFDTVLTGWS